MGWGAVWAAVFTAPAPALAWGNDGHRIVGDIAFHFLKPKAKAAVKEYLTEPRYSTLAEAATWPDTYARQYKKYKAMGPLHYVDIAPQASAYQESRDCPNRCVVTGLDKYFAVLAGADDDTASWKSRQQALYWVSHFVGDIHQPLHVAHPDMDGGNKTFVQFFGQRMKAHEVWDRGLLARLELTFRAPADRDEDAGDDALWQELSFALVSELSPQQVKTWQTNLSPKDWANETLAVAKQKAFLKPNETVDQPYVDSHASVVKQQLQKAGVRLAAVLNQVFG